MTYKRKIKTVKGVVTDMVKAIDRENIADIRALLDNDYSPLIVCSTIDKVSVLPCHAIQSVKRKIRNVYGLWTNNLSLFEDCLRVDYTEATRTYHLWKKTGIDQEELDNLPIGKVHPDDASQVIFIRFLWKVREMHANHANQERDRNG